MTAATWHGTAEGVGSSRACGSYPLGLLEESRVDGGVLETAKDVDGVVKLNDGGACTYEGGGVLEGMKPARCGSRSHGWAAWAGGVGGVHSCVRRQLLQQLVGVGIRVSALLCGASSCSSCLSVSGFEIETLAIDELTLAGMRLFCRKDGSLTPCNGSVTVV